MKDSELQYDAKYPMIYTTRKAPSYKVDSSSLFLHYHHLNGHVGSYQVLAEIRQWFWIFKVVSSVKRVLSQLHVASDRVPNWESK